MTAAAHTSGSVARLVGGTLVGRDDLPVTGLATVAEAGPGQMTFIGDLVNANRWAASRAGTAVVTRGIAVPGHDPATRALIEVESADLAMIPVLELYFQGDPLPEPGIAAGAHVHPTASVDPAARIGPGAVVGARARVGAGASIHANAVLYEDAEVGERSIVHAGAVIRERCVVGRDCIVGAGVVLGGDGFGYRASADGRSVLRVPHLGNVVLEDGVELGSGTMIDRGKFGATRIGAGTKIDNLCQIGHNVEIGRFVVMSGMTGVAGSTRIGDGCRIGGGCGIADHLVIGRGVSLAARSGVMSDVPDGATWGGIPAQELRSALREIALIRKLPEWHRQLKHFLEAPKNP